VKVTPGNSPGSTGSCDTSPVLPITPDYLRCGRHRLTVFRYVSGERRYCNYVLPHIVTAQCR